MYEVRPTFFEDTLEKTFGLRRDREDLRNSQNFVRALREGWQVPRGKMESSNTFNGAFAISASPR